jgi:hypothetical protein
LSEPPAAPLASAVDREGAKATTDVQQTADLDAHDLVRIDDGDQPDKWVRIVRRKGEHFVVSDPRTGEESEVPISQIHDRRVRTPKDPGTVKISEDLDGTIPDEVRVQLEQDRPTQEKRADFAQFLRRRDTIRFTPDNRLVVQRLPNRRFRFLDTNTGKRAPYEDPVRFIPAQGVPEPGYHGYDIELATDEGDVPEGYETIDPKEALKTMYGSMGLAVNKPYREVDRARARVILRALRKRAPQQPTYTPPAAPVIPEYDPRSIA